MKTTILWLAIGALAGTAGTLAYSKRQTNSAELRVERAAAANSLLKQLEEDVIKDDLPEVLLRSTNAGDRSMFVLVAAKADAQELEKLIYESAAKLQGKARRFSLEILFARYAELDAPAALKLADSLQSDNELRASIYGVWATNDTDGALSALQSMPNSAVSIAAGLAVIDALGSDALAFETVANWMPAGTNLDRFQAKAIAALALSNAEAAFSQLQLMPKSAFRLDATSELARNWAKHDPQGALAAIESIESFEERQAFQNQLLREWAKNDPRSVANYLVATKPGDHQQLNAFTLALRQLAIVQPDDVLAISDSLDPRLQHNAKRYALQSIAKRDPGEAVAVFNSMPEAFKRNGNTISSISEALGRADPETALQWAASLTDRNKYRVGAVLSVMAKDDPEGAMDMAFAVEDKVLRQALIRGVATNAIYSSQQPGRVLERFMEEIDGGGNEYLQGQLFSLWADRDLNAALDWMSTYDGEIGRYGLAQIANDIVERDPQAAIAATARIKAKDQKAWTSAVARTYAASDPQAALAWIESLRGQELYNSAMGAAAEALVETNVDLALNTASELQNDKASVRIATAAIQKISKDNPERAITWAMNQSSERLRSQSLRVALSEWAQKDHSAASQRARRLPAGKSKDKAVSAVIQIGLWHHKGNFDESMLDEISNEFTRQQAAVSAATFLAQKDKKAALSLLERQISNPAMLEAAKQDIKTSRRY